MMINILIVSRVESNNGQPLKFAAGNTKKQKDKKNN